MNFDIILRNPGSFNIQLSIPSATYTKFLTPLLLTTTFNRGFGEFGVSVGMKATSSTPINWVWGTIENSASYYYPSGINQWIWVAGNYGQ